MRYNEATKTGQQAVVAFLSEPKSYGFDGEPVTRIDTHISVVFLIGDRAYKMKRALQYPYLDYATLADRKRFCEAELHLNRRTAPMLYRDVVPVTRARDGSLRLGGEGEPIEWLVEMARFDQAALFDRMALAGQLTPTLLTQLADEIAAFHAAAETVAIGSGAERMAWIVGGNADEIGQVAEGVFDAAKVALLTERANNTLRDISGLLDDRAAQGWVRRCHGDLHLRNICLVEDRPVLFDGIEFSDRFSVIDVLYDLAFLLMDLEHRGLRNEANLVFNRYMAMTGAWEGLAALPLFLSCRAAVRAKTTVSAASSESAQFDALFTEAREYLDLACSALQPAAPMLIAVGGLSGSGKSTLAQRLAPHIGRAPGALVLRSDVMRKRLFDVAPESALHAAAYTREQSTRVYEGLKEAARAALVSGQSVILDAVFAQSEERIAMEQLAAEAGVQADFLWLDAPPDTLQRRVTARTGDASDADASVVRQQLTYDTGSIAWHRIDAGLDADKTLEAARAIVVR